MIVWISGRPCMTDAGFALFIIHRQCGQLCAFVLSCETPWIKAPALFQSTQRHINIILERR